jgi:hypothetical protein
LLLLPIGCCGGVPVGWWPLVRVTKAMLARSAYEQSNPCRNHSEKDREGDQGQEHV